MFLLFVILALIFFVSNIVGKAINESLSLNLKFNSVIGYLSLLACCQLFAIPLIIMKINSATFQVILGIIVTFLISVSLITLIKFKHVSLRNIFKFSNYSSFKEDVVVFSIILIISIIAYIFIMSDYRADRMSDSSFYIPMMLENIDTNAIYSIDPWSGLNQGFSSLYKYVSYELFHSSIIGIFNISPLLYINHGMILINLFLIVTAAFELSTRIFKNRKMSYLAFITWIFTVFIFITGIEDGFFFFFSTDMIQRVPYTGKVLTYLCVVPMFFIITQQLLYNLKSKKILLALMIINISATALTATSLFVLGIFYFSIILILIYKKIDSKEIIGYCLTTAPLLLHIALIQFKILLIPLIICYLLLTLLYFSRLKLDWLIWIMKGILYSIVIVLPILSIVVNVFTFFNKVDSITFLKFIEKIWVTINFKTLLVWFVAALGCYSVIKNKKLSMPIRYMYGYAPILMVVIFINPINSAFISKFVTTIYVYQRLFYILPLLPLMGFGIEFILDKYIRTEEKNHVIYFCIISLIALSYNPFKYVVNELRYKIINDSFNFEYMLNNFAVDTNKYFEELNRPVRVAHYFIDNQWGAELRPIRQVAPNVILPYNTYVYRDLTENQKFNKETYQQYQLHLLMNESIWLYDPYIDINGRKTDRDNYEFALQYLDENYDYIVIAASNETFGKLLEGFGAIKVYENERDAIYNLSELNYN